MIAQAASGDALDPYLVLALVRQESLFNPQARSVSDARGLMQLMPATADRIGPSAGVEQASLNLFDPSLSVRVGTAYLKNLFDMFGGDPFKAVAAYNAGEHAVQRWNAKYPGDDDQWVENIGFRETRDYVKRVMGGLREYRMLYPRTRFPAARRSRRARRRAVAGRTRYRSSMRARAQRLPGPLGGSFVGIDVGENFLDLAILDSPPRTLVFKRVALDGLNGTRLRHARTAD